MVNASIQTQGYAYFLTEAQDLLHAIEQDLFGLQSDRTTSRVHSLMRSAHTLKGAAASVGLESIKSMAHSLEDVFKSLYNPAVVIDAELERLLFEGYECLRTPIMTAVAGRPIADNELLNQATPLFERLQTKLGDHFDPGASIPSSAELGFDIAQSIFESGVQERLDQIASALATEDAQAITDTLATHADVFMGLAESLGLPGFGQIAQTTLAALAAQPQQTIQVARVALADFRQAQALILSGDRTQGGQPSVELQQLARPATPATAEKKPFTPPVPQPHEAVPLRVHPAVRSSGSPVDQIRQVWRRFWDLLSSFSDVDADPAEPLALPAAIVPPTQSSTPIARPEPTPRQTLESLASNELENLADQWDAIAPQAKPSLSEVSELFSAFETLANVLPVESVAPAVPVPPERSSPVSRPSALPSVAPVPVAAPPLSVENSAQPILPSSGPISEPPQPASSPITTLQPAPETATIRVDLEHLESLNHTIGELLINQNRQSLQDEQLHQFVQELLEGLSQHQQTLVKLRDWSDQLLTRSSQFPGPSVFRSSPSLAPYQTPPTATLSTASPLLSFDSLEFDRHNELHAMVQTALEECMQLDSITSTIDLSVQRASQALQKQGRLLGNTRDDLMDVRMTPIGNLLNRFPRLVQQLSDRYGKAVNLDVRGTSVLVDKAIADKLYDSLLHLIRNAFDHGIESADTRRSQGKPEVGNIELRAYQQGNRTMLHVRDDGQGLNLGKICRRGFELGLLASDQLEQFSQADILNLLFEPGFSTAAQVSELSGRGVGLDVVADQMRSLKGIVTVDSEPNQGTTFTLQLPLTLMTARLLICQVGPAVYAFLSDEIERIVLPQPDQIETLSGQRVFHWRQGSTEIPVPVCVLADLMRYSSPLIEALEVEQSFQDLRLQWSGPMSTPNAPLLLVSGPNGWIGITVDQIVGEQELVIGPLGRAIAPPNYIYGCSILGDGRLTLALDIMALLKQGFNPKGHKANREKKLPIAQPHRSHSLLPPSTVLPQLEAIAVKRILIIDDSITVRQTLALLLNQAGYQVVQAQDGLEAIAQLNQYPDIQAITCDLEMPRLNGFEFLMRYKQEFSQLQAPVIIVTSRSSDKHRQLALQLGAAAYLTKPYTPQEMLNTVAELTTV